MATATQDDSQREIQGKLQDIPQAEWVRAMIDHFRRTGTYRARDLRRLLGDPNRSVEFDPNASLASCFSAKVEE